MNGDLERDSSRWAVGLIGAALFLVIILGMIRTFTEKWSRRKEPKLHGG